MKKKAEEPTLELEDDIAEVLLSKLQFRAAPEEAGADASPEGEESGFAVEWTPPAATAASVSDSEPVQNREANVSAGTAEGHAPSRVVRLPTGNRGRQATHEEIMELANEHGLSLDEAAQVASGAISLRLARHLRQVRARKARVELEKETRTAKQRRIALLLCLACMLVILMAVL